VQGQNIRRKGEDDACDYDDASSPVILQKNRCMTLTFIKKRKEFFSQSFFRRIGTAIHLHKNMERLFCSVR